MLKDEWMLVGVVLYTPFFAALFLFLFNEMSLFLTIFWGIDLVGLVILAQVISKVIERQKAIQITEGIKNESTP